MARAIDAAKPGVPFTTPITAAVAAFRHLGARRIAVLTPYVDEVNEAIRGFLVAAGLDVVEFGSFHLRTEQEIARVPPEAIVAAGRSITGPGAEALFISCTGLQGHAAIAALEAATGRPVVTSNQAQVWEALSLIGYARPLHGYGRLLASSSRPARHRRPEWRPCSRRGRSSTTGPRGSSRAFPVFTPAECARFWETTRRFRAEHPEDRDWALDIKCNLLFDWVYANATHPRLLDASPSSWARTCS